MIEKNKYIIGDNLKLLSKLDLCVASNWSLYAEVSLKNPFSKTIGSN